MGHEQIDKGEPGVNGTLLRPQQDHTDTEGRWIPSCEISRQVVKTSAPHQMDVDEVEVVSLADVKATGSVKKQKVYTATKQCLDKLIVVEDQTKRHREEGSS